MYRYSIVKTKSKANSERFKKTIRSEKNGMFDYVVLCGVIQRFVGGTEEKH